MSDEEKIVEKKDDECKCFCKSEGFRNFLTIALGTFVGVYAALSLFTAIHKPPIMPPCGHRFMYGGPAPIAAPCPFRQSEHKSFHKPHREHRPDFDKVDKFNKDKAPFEKRIEADD